MFIVRPYRTGDETGVVATVRAVYDEYGFTWDEHGYCADLYDLDGHYGGDAFAFWIAETEAGIAGCGGLETFPLVPGEPPALVPGEGLPRLAGTDCGLLRLYVHPEARRQGIGSALFETVIAEARRRGCRALEIWSDKRLLDAHRLYERRGAVRVGERICDDPDDSPEWGMLLRLD
ncbi:MAG TPA: GNAT family N-acetyltransferase [Fimbriimonadaceae bacterium]|nr:GNAT family N-acetyltransferase [Fimbriimonadaceae bacterium]HRJ96746.1 GNAT family N-acetyltransferase [Fimbriimonadaceae bacterium]